MALGDRYYALRRFTLRPDDEMVAEYRCRVDTAEPELSDYSQGALRMLWEDFLPNLDDAEKAAIVSIEAKVSALLPKKIAELKNATVEPETVEDIKAKA